MQLSKLLTNPKVLLLGAGAIGGLGVLAALTLFLWIRGGCGEDLNQSAELFARQAIETIADDWDHEAVLDLMPPQARDQASFVSSLQKSCKTLQSELGALTGPVDIRGQARGRLNLSQKAFASATYSSRCTFERGSITISINLFKNLKIVGPNDPWCVINIQYSGLEK